MRIQRLNPDKDRALISEAFYWDINAPQWYADSDAICRPDIETYMKMSRDETQVDIGIFTDEMVGLVTVDYKGNGIAEIRLSAKRGSSLEVLAEAAWHIRRQFFALGMKAAVVWVAKRNRQVIRLCGMIGFEPDKTMTRGTYQRGNQPIEWLRMVARRV